MDDVTLERAILAKYPQYADLPRTSAQPSEADQAAAFTGPTMQQARSQAVPAELRPQSRAIQFSIGGMPQFVDVPSDEKKSFKAAGQRGYQTGGKAAVTLGVPSAVLAPVSAALAVGGGMAGGKLARAGPAELGADQDVQDIVEGAGNFVGRAAGGALNGGTRYAARQLLFHNQNRFVPTPAGRDGRSMAQRNA
jgi:hypothetical protein